MTTATKPPAEEKIFDSKRDREIIEGGGFYCQACLEGKPPEEQSDDPRYCHLCFKYLNDEWDRITVFAYDDGRSKDIKKPGWVPIIDRHSNHHEQAPVIENVVTKNPDKDIIPVGIMLHKRGRPRKEGAVTRMTEWRRKKQGTQGILI